MGTVVSVVRLMALAELSEKIVKMPILILFANDSYRYIRLNTFDNTSLNELVLDGYEWKYGEKSVTILAEIPCLMNRMDTEKAITFRAALILMKFIMRERLYEIAHGMQRAIASGHIRLLVKYLSVFCAHVWHESVWLANYRCAVESG